MRVLVSSEHRFQRTPDGAVWTQPAYRFEFWQHYLEVFDHVQVLARVLHVPSVGHDWHRADGAGVDFAGIPHYIGPLQYLARYRRIHTAATNALAPDAAVIMRVPSFLSSHLTPRLYATGQPFGVEVVGDPLDTFGPGSVDHPLRPFLRWWLPRQLREQCVRASAVAYVTKFALQARYPCRAFGVGVSDVQLPSEAIRVEDNVLATHYSSVELSIGDCFSRRLSDAARNRELRLVTVASLEQRYKGVDLLISAIATCVRAGLDASLTVIGDGKYRGDLQRLAEGLGVRQRVTFLGQLPAGAAVRRELDRSDIFVLASLTEGLPRAMVEAMARALPCIGTAVGGIPELLPPEDLAPPGDAAALAARILEVARDPDRRIGMSSRNRVRARDYSDPVLREYRLAFYRHLRQVMSGWTPGRAPGGRPQVAGTVAPCGSSTS
jgi:glycosyltransferase involved in cell wall biosynthesis